VTGVLLGALLAVIAAAGALGSGDRQAREYLTRIERQYAAAKEIPWSAIRPVIRSNISADDKLTAIVKVLGKVDPRVLPRFVEADKALSNMHRYLRMRYAGLLALAVYLLSLLFISVALPDSFVIPHLNFVIQTEDFLLLLFLLPLIWILYVLHKLGSLEVQFYKLYDRLEELL
jgi:hypothetical protein